MSAGKRLAIGLAAVSIFMIGYPIAATITSTQVNSGIRVRGSLQATKPTRLLHAKVWEAARDPSSQALEKMLRLLSYETAKGIGKVVQGFVP